MKLVITTCEEKDASRIADSLLREKLVACVNILGPVESKYWWQGKLETASERILLMKTQDKLLPLLRKRLKEIHPYKVPEIISFNINEVNPEYLSWVEEVTGSPGK